MQPPTPHHWRKYLHLAILALCLVPVGATQVAGQTQSSRAVKQPSKAAAYATLLHQHRSAREERSRPASSTNPSAAAPAFSFDGKYAAYLHRPYEETATGKDLWIRETATGKTFRMSSLAPASSGLAATVPSFRSVFSFTWSPTANELLFVSQGLVYRWKEGDKQPVQLSAAGTDWKMQYLPDGTGYTYSLYGAIEIVSFANASTRDFPIKLGRGESLVSYHVSPDGRHVVVMTNKGDRHASTQTFPIATYGGRYMKVVNVGRTLADDPVPASEQSMYVADLADPRSLTKVFSFMLTGHGDCLSQPRWSPDSRKVVFSRFVQTTRQIDIFQAEVAAEAPAGMRPEPARPAQSLYHFIHTGGPATPAMIQPEYLADSRRLVLMAEQTGFRHLHVLDPARQTFEQVTRGAFEVYPLVLSKDRQSYYVASTREDPACRDIYRVALEAGSMQRLTRNRGVYGDIADVYWKDQSGRVADWTQSIRNTAVSPDGRTVLANFTAFGTLNQLVRINTATGGQETVVDYYPASIRQDYRVRPEFFTYRNRHGQEIRGYLFKPDGWKTTDKRPLLVYVYGGMLGIDKMVMEGNIGQAAYTFAIRMAKKHGYVTCVIDPRGSSGYGADFEKANFEHPGRPQVEDLVDGVHYLVKNYGVDAKRVGIHGWSFGGFQTQMCMYLAPDVFAVGIAGAGPTEWRNYQGWYVTATIGATRQGHPDLAKFSLLPLAKNLKGRLLLVHGMMDDNVLFQDTLRLYQALLRAGKETQVELFLDPTGKHGLGGDVSEDARYHKFEDFLLRNLGTGLTPQSPAAPAAKKAA